MNIQPKDTVGPPKLAQRFLNWFLKRDLAEEVLGDLEEKFFDKLAAAGAREAKLNYWYQVLNYLRPFAIRNNLITDLNPFFMFRTNFKIAWRHLFKQRLNSLINITGITVGLTCFILIALYIQYESSYDLQHEKADRTYRIIQRQKGNDFRGTDMFAVAPMTIGPALEEQFPEVEKTVTFTTFSTLFLHQEQLSYESGLHATESLFDVFTYPVLEGNAKAALKDKDAIILTRSMAEKYFGDIAVIGNTMRLRDDRLLTVQAVIEDVPGNQHFDFDFVLSIENYGEYVEDRKHWRWASNNYMVYVVLSEGSDPQVLEGKMSVFDDEVKAAYATLPFRAKYFLEPLTDIYLHSKANFGEGIRSDIRYIYLSATIGFIILLLALINFMNLSVARFRQRSKEVGVRKVLGAKRKQLITQFMTESVLVTVLSFVFAIGLSALLLPAFNELMDLQIPFLLSDNKIVLFTLLSIAILLGVVSGLYPALLSSGTAPVKALSGNWFKGKNSKAFFRNALIVGQFTAAIVLAISSIIIFQQLQYIQNKKVGYNREQVVYIPYRNQELFTKTTAIREELMAHPDIENVTITSTLPLNTNSQGIATEWEGNTTGEELFIYRIRTDYNFIDLFEMDLVEGRNFSTEHPTDSTNTYILNETAVKALGWTSAVGKSFRNGRVIGVVEDFHFQPFDLSIEPMFITFHNDMTSYYGGSIAMKIRADDPGGILAHAEEVLKGIMPQMPVEMMYMDESFKQLHQSERRFGEAFRVFTFLALFIACIGLFGLVTHTVLQRTKEIGVRKVLGASAINIVSLISRDFMLLVLFSAALAIPIAWWGMGQWLADFAYRMEMNIWVFVVTGFVAILIAFFTIGSQSLNAALANPVDAIKSE